MSLFMTFDTNKEKLFFQVLDTISKKNADDVYFTHSTLFLRIRW
jgi:hypothetical protein